MKRTKPYFSKINKIICEELDSADYRLLIAIAWMTDKEIVEKLLERIDAGIRVEVIIDDNKFNRNNFRLTSMKSKATEFSFIKNLNSATSIMHNKFCVIDYNRVITGSYNWTENAKNNNENIVIIDDNAVATEYAIEFRKIKLDKGLKFDVQNINQKITDRLYNLFIRILEKEIVPYDTPKNGILFNYSDKIIKNQILEILEFESAEVHSKLSSFWRFERLIEKYGFVHWQKRSTFKEKRKEEDFFWTEVIKNVHDSVNPYFAVIQKRTIEKLQKAYSDAMNGKDMNQSKRIMKIISYLIQEKKQIVKKYYLN